MIDIHAHIIPGIDDGSADMNESLHMAEIAIESGVDAIVCTPHSNLDRRQLNYWDEELAGRLAELNEEVQHLDSYERRPLKLIPGMEIFGTEDTADLIRDGKLIGLNFTDNYLIEFGFGRGDTYMTRILNKMLSAGVKPIVAHPERYACVQDDSDVAKLWVEMGCRLQVNKGSLFGRFGRSVWRTAGELLEEDLVSFVASDAHGPFQRTTKLQDAWDFLFDEFSPEMADALLTENQLDMLREPRGKYAPEGCMPIEI